MLRIMGDQSLRTPHTFWAASVTESKMPGSLSMPATIASDTGWIAGAIASNAGTSAVPIAVTMLSFAILNWLPND